MEVQKENALTRQLCTLMSLEKHHKIQKLPKRILLSVENFVRVVAEEYHISDSDLKVVDNPRNTTDSIFPTERYSSVVPYPGKKKTPTPSPIKPLIFPGEFVGEEKETNQRVTQQKAPLVEKWLQSVVNKFSNDELDTQQKEYEDSVFLENMTNWPSVSQDNVEVGFVKSKDLNLKTNNNKEPSNKEQTKKKLSPNQYNLRNVSSDAENNSKVEKKLGKSSFTNEKENQISKLESPTDHNHGILKSKVNLKQKFKKIKKELSDSSTGISKLNVSIATYGKISKNEVTVSKKPPIDTQYSIHEITGSPNLPSDPLLKDRLACEAVLQRDSLEEGISYCSQPCLTKQICPFYYRSKCAPPKRANADNFKMVTINLNLAGDQLVQIVSPRVNILNNQQSTGEVTKRTKDISVQTDFKNSNLENCEDLKSQDIFVEDEQEEEKAPTLILNKSSESQENFKSKPTSSIDTAIKRTESLQPEQSGRKHSTPSKDTIMKQTQSLQSGRPGQKYSTSTKDTSLQASNPKQAFNLGIKGKAAPQESENLFTATEPEAYILTPQLASVGERQLRRCRSNLPLTPTTTKVKRLHVDSSDDNSVEESPQKPKPKVQRISRRNSISHNTVVTNVPSDPQQKKPMLRRLSFSITPRKEPDTMTEASNASNYYRPKVQRISRRNSISQNTVVTNVPSDSQQKKPILRELSVSITPCKEPYTMTEAPNASVISVSTPVELKRFSEDIRHKSTPICNTVKKTLVFGSRRLSVGKATPEKVDHNDTSNNRIVAESDPFEAVPVIITSALHLEQTQQVLKVIGERHWKFQRLYSRDVTHLVTQVNDENRAPRTLKYLQAVVGKKWILSYAWIQECAMQGKHVSEEPYEMNDDSGLPGPRASRLSATKIFSGLVFYCVPTSIFTPCDIRALLEDAGGRVVDDIDSLTRSAGDNPYSAIVLANAKEAQQQDYFIDLAYRKKILPLDLEWVMQSIGSQVIQSFRLHLLCPEAGLPSSILSLSQTFE